MTKFELIGVPFDGFGRDGHQARASSALRAAGFAEAFGSHAHDSDLELPPGEAVRAVGSGLLNERALIAQTRSLGVAVDSGIRTGRCVVVYGGDCTSLLGTLTGFRAALGDAALVFVDGHEDTMPLDVSEDGEAANTEIGLLLGLTGRLAPPELRAATIARERLAMIGQRDAPWRQQFNVGSLRDRGVWLRDAHETAADAASVAREAVAHVTTTSPDWWLHIDLDVLDPLEFAAQGVPGGDDQPGGLTWAHLTELAIAAVRVGGCRGLSLAIYDPEQDPTAVEAARIVAFARELAANL